MPVKILDSLPAAATLAKENIFVMPSNKAAMQDIRPLRIAILNLMPTKVATETQLLRLLGNTSLQVEPVFLRTASYTPTNISSEHLDSFYSTFAQEKNNKFDGLIITGAPIEQMEFEQVTYWQELKEIMEWANHNVYSTLYICWGAQAGLYYNYKIPKKPLQRKLSGVYKHRVCVQNCKLLRGFDDLFYAPHSRNTEVLASDIAKVCEIEILADSQEAGVYIAASKDLRQVFVTGHSEYDWDTLQNEYQRDIASGLNIDPPANYYPYNDPSLKPQVLWRSHANLLFGNWLNYCVYQETPYDIHSIEGRSDAGSAD